MELIARSEPGSWQLCSGFRASSIRLSTTSSLLRLRVFPSFSCFFSFFCFFFVGFAAGFLFRVDCVPTSAPADGRMWGGRSCPTVENSNILAAVVSQLRRRHFPPVERSIGRLSSLNRRTRPLRAALYWSRSEEGSVSDRLICWNGIVLLYIIRARLDRSVASATMD